MKLIIIGGLKGSGKTSLISKLIALLQRDKDINIAVIQNEVGEVKLPQQKDRLEVSGLSGGCICCTLTAGLSDMLSRLKREYDPEYVLVEASGEAMIEKVSGTVRDFMPEIRNCLGITVCDASEYRENMDSGLDVLIGSQLSGGDIIVLTKGDLVAPAAMDDVRGELIDSYPDKTVISGKMQDIAEELYRKIISTDTPKKIDYFSMRRR